jgi:hypothetical protein
MFPNERRNKHYSQGAYRIEEPTREEKSSNRKLGWYAKMSDEKKSEYMNKLRVS